MEPALLGLSNNEATVFLFADERGVIPFPRRSADDNALLMRRLRHLLDRGYIRREVDEAGYVAFALTERGMRLKAKLES